MSDNKISQIWKKYYKNLTEKSEPDRSSMTSAGRSSLSLSLFLAACKKADKKVMSKKIAKENSTTYQEIKRVAVRLENYPFPVFLPKKTITNRSQIIWEITFFVFLYKKKLLENGNTLDRRPPALSALEVLVRSLFLSSESGMYSSSESDAEQRVIIKN